MTKMNVMLVEDEALIRKYLCSVIEKNGGVVIAQTALGEEAVDLVLRDNPDVVFMDIMLDGEIDGIEAARRIAEIARIPIVFVSAYDYEEALFAEDALNFFAYINKPVDRHKVTDVLGKVRSAS